MGWHIHEMYFNKSFCILLHRLICTAMKLNGLQLGLRVNYWISVVILYGPFISIIFTHLAIFTQTHISVSYWFLCTFPTKYFWKTWKLPKHRVAYKFDISLAMHTYVLPFEIFLKNNSLTNSLMFVSLHQHNITLALQLCRTILR